MSKLLYPNHFKLISLFFFLLLLFLKILLFWDGILCFIALVRLFNWQNMKIPKYNNICFNTQFHILFSFRFMQTVKFIPTHPV